MAEELYRELRRMIIREAMKDEYYIKIRDMVNEEEKGLYMDKIKIDSLQND